MMVWRRAAAYLVAAALAWGVGASRLESQSVRLSLSATVGDSASPAPSMTVTGFQNQPQLGPYSISLELSLESQFRTPFYARTNSNESAIFTIDSLLPERTVVFFRARLADRFGNVVAETRDQHPVRSWLRLVSPADLTVTQLPTRSPRFVWSSPAITVGPGLWSYDLSIINTRTGQADFTVQALQDTSYVFPQPLESSTSYRWQVRARAENGPPSDQVTATSAATFVIASPDQPTVTLFYQNFPNPFGRGTRTGTTCFWFDLAHASTVTLTIYNISLRPVRSIIPGRLGDGKLAVGAYPALRRSGGTGCDDALAWDGRDDAGRFVPLGVYLAIFKGDGVTTSKKILFKGP
ncbi:MAG: hypothetical protein JWM41_2120 [Gemmatimonadetes bacterium]|nr:hypothetical protein [Gemmatimonadota bacterium]